MVDKSSSAVSRFVTAVAAAEAISRTRKTRVALALLIALSWPAPHRLHGVGDLGREVLANDDGWAALGAGTTGGAAATPDNVFVATNRQELIAALNNGVYPPPSSTPSSVPKIIYVAGSIDANVDDGNQPLSCTDYYRNGYTIEAYLAAYDPATWGRVPPSGPLEAARVASQMAQQARVRIRVGSNTTIVGLDKTGTIRGAWLDLRGTAGVEGSRTNIIIRNINFRDAYDCFPQWSPTDGSEGNWNSQYDSISLRDTDHVWIDHNDFADVETADETLPVYFGRPFQVHDGHVDITNASNYVTVSWNRLRDHDKVMLIGSSDSAAADRGKLKVTLHHNLFENVGQRAPRVRFGQVHVYNNYYRNEGFAGYVYSWGVGVESQIYAENNFFRTFRDITPDRFIARFNGTAVVTLHTSVDAASENHVVDVRAEYNLANDPDLAGAVGWVPVLHRAIDQSRRVPGLVESRAGPMNW
jgi:pectate lyase